MAAETRADAACNDFVDSGEKFIYPYDRAVGPTICSTCGWVEDCHHKWKRTGPVWVLGPGWQCGVCGRTAYDKDGRCTENSPPADYPPCSRFQFDGVTD